MRPAVQCALEDVTREPDEIEQSWPCSYSAAMWHVRRSALLGVVNRWPNCTMFLVDAAYVPLQYRHYRKYHNLTMKAILQAIPRLTCISIT